MNIQLNSIGTFHCPHKHKCELPQQSTVLTTKHQAYIELTLPNAELCLKDLNGFSHIWVLFHFNKNKNWKPLTSPPRLVNQKVGVFASRSPYRPNPIGMSLLEIEKISKNRIYVKQYDLIDKTPILDIKPYLTYTDCAEPVKQGWVESCRSIYNKSYTIKYSTLSKNQIDWINKYTHFNLYDFIQTQLSQHPTDKTRKRVNRTSTDLWEISFRTWRVNFKINEGANEIYINSLSSGYSKSEIENTNCDTYKDKNIHNLFTNDVFS